MQVAASAEPGQAIQNVAVLPHAETSVPREQSAMWDAEAQANLTGVQPQASTSSERTDHSATTTTLESVHEAPIVSPVQAADTSVAALASLSADAGTPSSAKNVAQSPSTSSADQHSNNSPANSLKLAVQVEQRTPDVAEATWAAAHAPMEAAQAGASCVPACSPPLTEGEIRDLSGIVLHTEKCAAFMHEVECRHAHVFKRPAPTAPEFNLRPDERQRLQAIARDPRLSRAAIDLRRAWLGCRLLGPDSMYRLPPPFVSLTEVEAGRIKAILNNSERRTYARYAAARVEALELGLSLPPQPTSDLPPKVRRQIRQLFSDSRLLTLIQHGLWTREPELENQPEVAEPGDPGAAQAASE
ncbi:hypothetical protein [Haliangium sp. UPWRP_2]|uniref:hypothetical protein n=1 Tax=Haliangium sp. UPWRP_2 TaxID=1931276 RepID=UPI0011B1E9B1|nr:hypothetical protein [Haliangium sp. UPWRP_2]